MPLDLGFSGPRYDAFDFGLDRFSIYAHGRRYKFHCCCKIRIMHESEPHCAVDMCYSHQNRFFFKDFGDEYPRQSTEIENLIYKAFQRHVTT